MKKLSITFGTILLVFGCFAPLPSTWAVIPPPDGGYANGNTAEGDSALFSLTVGVENTAIGAGALYSNTSGIRNTATGFQTLNVNSGGNFNTANGWRALHLNTGSANTATGFSALQDNTNSSNNTATGFSTLVFNTTGSNNTATGSGALENNNASNNTATGFAALISNNAGAQNTATGALALNSNNGTNNTGDGFQALLNSTGSNNIGLGSNAGSGLTTGSNNIDIGAFGHAADTNTIRIGKGGLQRRAFMQGIRGVTTGQPNAVPVVIDSTGQLGTVGSSRRFKHDIKPMDATSESILALKPVTFHYRSDNTNTAQFGLIAEEVAEVNPDLVVRDDKGKIYTVRYDAVNAMLLNEFLKEHKKVEQQIREIEEQKNTISELKKGMDSVFAQLKDQASQIQKVNAQLELSKGETRTVANKE